jgi:hypothetical protein
MHACVHRLGSSLHLRRLSAVRCKSLVIKSSARQFEIICDLGHGMDEESVSHGRTVRSKLVLVLLLLTYKAVMNVKLNPSIIDFLFGVIII